MRKSRKSDFKVLGIWLRDPRTLTSTLPSVPFANAFLLSALIFVPYFSLPALVFAVLYGLPATIWGLVIYFDMRKKEKKIEKAKTIEAIRQHYFDATLASLLWGSACGPQLSLRFLWLGLKIFRHLGVPSLLLKLVGFSIVLPLVGGFLGRKLRFQAEVDAAAGKRSAGWSAALESRWPEVLGTIFGILFTLYMLFRNVVSFEVQGAIVGAGGIIVGLGLLQFVPYNLYKWWLLKQARDTERKEGQA
jgi:hypothetical protein